MISKCFVINFIRFEPSTKQVQNAINHNAVDKWQKKISLKVQKEIWSRCPMLKKLGYKEK